MGLFGSKKKKLARADSSNAGSRGFKLGFRKIFGSFGKYVSCMFTTAEPKRTYIDVYHRPEFNKSLSADPGNGYSSTDIEYAERMRCNSFKITGFKRRATVFDTDMWSDSEITEYDNKLKPIMVNDEVADMMKMSVAGLGADAMELEDFGYYSEADIQYEAEEVPQVKPGFLPEIIREEKVEEIEEVPVEVPKVEVIPAPVVEEVAEEKITEQPVAEEVAAPVVEEPVVEVAEPVKEEPIVEEPVVEIELVEENETEEIEITVEEPVVAIEAPEVAGLLMEAKEETIELVEQPVAEEVAAPVVEEPVVEVAEPVKEEPQAAPSMFSFGFGTASASNAGSVGISFGFGASEEKAEESSFINNSVFVSSDAIGQKV